MTPFCSNHWHAVVWPESDGDLSAFMQQITNMHVKRWRNIGTRLGMAICARAATSVFPWKPRAISTKSSAMSSERASCNLVARAEDWLWSSLRRAERDDPAFPILSDWPLPRPSDWLEIVNQPQSEAELDALRRAELTIVPSAAQSGPPDREATENRIDTTFFGRPRKEK